ncbi:MAG TPA: hypothetical protein VD993_07305 [Chitinophagaceae bacterium]|nr:hypothetical protein [Chitinophagaceae bacterium]
MQASNKSIVAIVAGVLTVAFFMPWIQLFFALSGWDIVIGKTQGEDHLFVKLIMLLFPISGLLILFGAVLNNEKYPLPKSFLFKLPLWALIVLIVVLVIKSNGLPGEAINGIFRILGVGFWLTLIAAVILPFVAPAVVSAPGPSNTPGNAPPTNPPEQ